MALSFLKDIRAGTSGSSPSELTVLGDEGTQLVKDIYPGPFSSIVPDEWNPIEFDGKLYFAAADPEAGYELWQTDGTEAGTFRVFDLFPGPESGAPEQLTVASNKLYFSAYSPPLWA